LKILEKPLLRARTASSRTCPNGWQASMQRPQDATIKARIALGDLDPRPVLSTIKVHGAIFHGTKDKICYFVFAEQMHKGIQNSYIIRFGKSEHALFIEEMEKFNSELEICKK